MAPRPIRDRHKLVTEGSRVRSIRWFGDDGGTGGRGADKKTRQGRTTLFQRREWCPLDEIQGHDPDVLGSPTIAEGLERILRAYEPRTEIAWLGLCTSKRPYSLSAKWARILEAAGGWADFIIQSNGGLIPIEFEDSFPFLNYDAHGQARFDELYVRVTLERTLRFFREKRYRFVLFHFRPTLRNARVAKMAGPILQEEGAIDGYAILPTAEALAAGPVDLFSQLFPELRPAAFAEALDQVRAWRRELDVC